MIEDRHKGFLDFLVKHPDIYREQAIARRLDCPTCNGKGYVAGPATCGRCRGKGKVPNHEM